MNSRHDHLIWRATHEFNPPVYLLGTMHLDSGLFPVLRERIQRLTDFVQLLATEVDLNEMAASVFPGHTVSIRARLRNRSYERLRQQLWRFYRLEINTLDQVPPIFIYQFLIERILPSTMERPIDHYVWDIAGNKGIERTGLETMERQFELAGRLDLDWQIRSLLGIARSPRRFKRKIMDMVDSYREERLPALYQASKKQLGPYRKLMLYDRNRAMYQSMLTFIRDRPALIAVGAAHLWGAYGLIRLLKQDGYRVSPWRG
ncbi:MAG: TraB/GumN family protein [Saprospiraceae bacterium]